MLFYESQKCTLFKGWLITENWPFPRGKLSNIPISHSIIHKTYTRTVTCLIAMAWKIIQCTHFGRPPFQTIHHIKSPIRCTYFSGKTIPNPYLIYLLWPIIKPYTVLVSVILLLINQPGYTCPVCEFTVRQFARPYALYGCRFLWSWRAKINYACS